MNCIQCHAPLQEGSKFCKQCGAPASLQNPPQTPVRPFAADDTPLNAGCPQCGAPLVQNSKFCKQCGAGLNAPKTQNIKDRPETISTPAPAPIRQQDDTAAPPPSPAVPVAAPKTGFRKWGWIVLVLAVLLVSIGILWAFKKPAPPQEPAPPATVQPAAPQTDNAPPSTNTTPAPTETTPAPAPAPGATPAIAPESTQQSPLPASSGTATPSDKPDNSPSPPPSAPQPVVRHDCSGLNYASAALCRIEGPSRFWKCAPDGKLWNNDIPGCRRDINKSNDSPF